MIALLVLGAMFVSPFRQMLLGLGVFVVGAVVLAVVVGLGVVLIRRSERRSIFDSTQSATLNTALPPSATTFTPLEPGDIIVTGTTGGVGAYRTPPVWMKPGDVVEVEVTGIGVLRNPVVAEA